MVNYIPGIILPYKEVWYLSVKNVSENLHSTHFYYQVILDLEVESLSAIGTSALKLPSG